MKKVSRAETARQMFRSKPGVRIRDVVAATGLPERTVRAALAEVRAAGDCPASAEPAAKQHVTIEESGMAAIASSLSGRIHTLDQLLAATKVDLSIWEVERHIVNKWEVAMKQKSKTGKVSAITEPLVQVKAWLKRKAPQIVGMRAMMADLITSVRKVAPPPRRIRYAKSTVGHLAEIDQPDLHLGKLCWAAETGEDYDVKIAETAYMEGIARHRDAAAEFGVAKFLLPIGNDYLNVDNAAGETSNGTPQDEDGRWQRSYIRGRELLQRAIEYLRAVAPVHVVQVGGNHDYERGFYLADALSCIYHRQKDVTFDNRPTVRKYFAFGNSLIGYTHGDKELTKDLPLTMAVEVPQMWAASKFREIHCGHLHHRRDKVFQPVLEEKGVIVRHLSSLTAADAWHAGKGYRSQRASSCFIRHPERGVVAELQFNL